MNSKRTFIAVTLLTIFSACQPPRSPVIKKPLEIKGEVPTKTSDNVLIGIRVEVPQATVGCESPMHASMEFPADKEVWKAGTYRVTAQNGELLVDGKAKGKKIRLHPVDPDCFLQSNSLGYRGELIIKVVGQDKLTIINELDIDDYLKGVLPREVVMSWPDQSLRVQAVASRTYLASHLGSHAKQGFDLCSDVHCQVYGGVAKEHPKASEAVDATRDQILVYNGKPIGAFFHSNCGGMTEEISYVWGAADQPFLPRKKCGYGTDDPRYNWKISFSGSEIISALRQKTSVKGTKLISLHVKAKSPSGRAQTMTVMTDKGTYNLSGNEFRIAMNPEKIRSTLFTNVERHGDGYQFAGRGWGHGVGMCQWGAKGQAEHGRNYREILEFYYPHAELQSWRRK